MGSKEPILVKGVPRFHIKYPCDASTEYEVIEEKKRFFAIYFSNFGNRKFLSHRENQKNACRVAELLQEAYLTGKEYEEDSH